MKLKSIKVNISNIGIKTSGDVTIIKKNKKETKNGVNYENEK